MHWPLLLKLDTLATERHQHLTLLEADDVSDDLCGKVGGISSSEVLQAYHWHLLRKVK